MAKKIVSDSAIRFDTACTGLSGDFLISGGMLEINENLDTTGDLELKSTGADLKATITVAAGKTAYFD